MNQRQRRESIARKRSQQKKNREAKRPKSKVLTRYDVSGLLAMIRLFMHSDKEFVDKYSSRVARSKRSGILWLAFFCILNLLLYFDILPLSDEWDVPLFSISVFFAMMPWVEYLVVRDRISFWKKQFQENCEFAKDLEDRLSNFQ